MIKVNKFYGITSDKCGYQVVDLPIKQDKNGKDIYSYVSYHGTIDSAIKSIIACMQRKAVSENMMTLEDAVVEFQRIANDITEKLKVIE